MVRNSDRRSENIISPSVIQRVSILCSQKERQEWPEEQERQLKLTHPTPTPATTLPRNIILVQKGKITVDGVCYKEYSLVPRHSLALCCSQYKLSVLQAMKTHREMAWVQGEWPGYKGNGLGTRGMAWVQGYTPTI